MHTKHFTLSAFLLSAFAISTNATAPSSDSTIVSHIEEGGHISIICPENLLQRLAPIVSTTEPSKNDEEEATTTNSSQSATRVGYRVLVFDDNDVRTAKQNAQARRNQIASRFPEFESYIQFNSPYWRVKVGNFKTRSEAEAAMQAIRAAFPSYGSQLRVVRDRINNN